MTVHHETSPNLPIAGLKAAHKKDVPAGTEDDVAQRFDI